MKIGDKVSPEYLKKLGYHYDGHVAHGILAYRKDELVILIDRRTNIIFHIFTVNKEE